MFDGINYPDFPLYSAASFWKPIVEREALTGIHVGKHEYPYTGRTAVNGRIMIIDTFGHDIEGDIGVPEGRRYATFISYICVRIGIILKGVVAVVEIAGILEQAVLGTGTGRLRIKTVIGTIQNI
jgi:hypothetical protein